MKKPLWISLFSIGFLVLNSCTPPHYYIRSHTDRFYTVNGPEQDTALTSMLIPYKTGVDTQMKVVIGNTDIPLTKAQPECTLGNFMVDALWDAALKLDNNVQAAILNYGTIRLPYLAPGQITNGQIYELMPFDDMITIVDIPGTTLRQFCDHMAKGKGWPIHNILYVVKDRKAISVEVDGKPLNEHLVYRIATGSYIATGGDNCDFLVPLKKTVTSVFLRDALIDYISDLHARNRVLHPELEKRVSYAE